MLTSSSLCRSFSRVSVRPVMVAPVTSSAAIIFTRGKKSGINYDAKLQIILTEDVAGLGFKHEQVGVKHGYAKNFLMPTRRAVYANDEQRIKLGLPVVPKQTRREKKAAEQASAAASVDADAAALRRYQQSERRRLERITLRFKKIPKSSATKSMSAAGAAKKPTDTKDGQPVITVSERDARAERKAAAKMARDAGEEVKIPIVELQTPLTSTQILRQATNKHFFTTLLPDAVLLAEPIRVSGRHVVPIKWRSSLSGEVTEETIQVKVEITPQ